MTSEKRAVVMMLFMVCLFALTSLACDLRGWTQRNVGGADIGPPVNLPTDFPTSTVVVPPTRTSTPPPPPPPAENSSELPLNECVVPEDAYLWVYEDEQQSSGSRAERCLAYFVFTNQSDKKMWVSFYDTFDNNAMKSERWASFIMEPGEQRVEDVNRTVYADGVVTFSLFTRLFVIWDVPACRWVMEPGNEHLWEGRAEIIPQPCSE